MTSLTRDFRKETDSRIISRFSGRDTNRPKWASKNFWAPEVHRHVAAGLSSVTAFVLLSGVVESELPDVLNAYAAAGLSPLSRRGSSGWQAMLLERNDG